MSQPEEFRDFVLNHEFDQLAKVPDGRAVIFLEEDEYRGMQSIMAEAASPGSLNAALELLADIRAAAGDPDGKMMQTELVQHIAEIRERAELRDQGSDHFRDGTKKVPPEHQNGTGTRERIYALLPEIKRQLNIYKHCQCSKAGLPTQALLDRIGQVPGGWPGESQSTSQPEGEA